MSELTENYGNFINLYIGEGKLNQQPCEFQIGQQSDGKVIVFCPFLGDPPHLVHNEIELIGSTDDGKQVVAKGIVRQKQTIHPKLCESYIECFYESLRPFDMSIETSEVSKAHSVTFAITNFLFCGNDQESGGKGTCYNMLSLTLGGMDISIAKVADYENLVNVVDRGEKTEVTCELTFEVAGRTQEEVRTIANRICDLLTIAKGRKISWINYRIFDANSSEVFTLHENRLTDPKNGHKLINFRDSNRSINYLKRGYPAYKQFDSSYPTMLNGVGSMITDSNSSRFTLTRALIMFSVVDALGKKVLEQTLISQGKPLRNFYSISDKISALKTSYKVCLSTDEIDYFRDSRNSVVHELKFHTSDTVEEYEKCYHTFHRMLLRILDYQSVYYDISRPQKYGFQENILHPCP